MFRTVLALFAGIICSFSSLNLYTETHFSLQHLLKYGQTEQSQNKIENRKSVDVNDNDCKAGGGLENCGAMLKAPDMLCPSTASTVTLTIDKQKFRKKNNNCTQVRWETDKHLKIFSQNQKKGDTLTQSLFEKEKGKGRLKDEVTAMVMPQSFGKTGSITAKLVDKDGKLCKCGKKSKSPSKTKQIKIDDASITKFRFKLDDPVCEKCGVGKQDFVIRTNPAGHSDKVQVRLPNQGPGTHKATAILCESKKAEYTIIDQASGWHTVYDGTANPAGSPVDKTSWKRWKTLTTGFNPDVQVHNFYRGKVRYAGNWTWKKLGEAIKPPGGKFTTSKSISKTKSFSKTGTATFTFKGSGGSVSTSIGVQLETSTTNTTTSGGRECKCGKGCEFRYRNYQSTISLIRYVKKWEIEKTTTSFFGSSPKRPPNKAFGPGNIVKDDHQGLPEIGQQKYTNSAEKRCN